MKSNMRNLSMKDVVASVGLFFLGFRIFWRGFFWFKEQGSVLKDSAFYVALHELMPIWVWGFFVMIAGITLMAASLLIVNPRRTTLSAWLLLIGGTMSAVLYFFMTSASIYHSINWLTTVHMALITATNCAFAFVGGVYLAKR